MICEPAQGGEGGEAIFVRDKTITAGCEIR